MKFCTSVEVTNKITCDTFFIDWLRDVYFVGVENRPFPLTKPIAVNAAAATVQPMMLMLLVRLDCGPVQLL